MMKMGTWYFYSTTDKRWNVSGRRLVGMFMSLNECPEAKAELERLKALYGEMPEDLQFGYMKD